MAPADPASTATCDADCTLPACGDGCGCQTSSGKAPVGLFGLMLLALGMILRRRRG